MKTESKNFAPNEFQNNTFFSNLANLFTFEKKKNWVIIIKFNVKL